MPQKQKHIKRILVLGVGGSAGINFVDSLRMAPEKFYIVGTDTNKYHIHLPDIDKRYLVPLCTHKQYLNKINSVIKKERIEFVHAQPDIEVKMLGLNRNKIKAKTFLPSNKTIELCQNKIKLNQFLSMNKIPVPKSVHIKKLTDLKIALRTLRHSKNEKIWLRAIRGAGSKAALPIKQLNHGLVWIDYWRKMRGLKTSDFMASEFLPGKEYAFQSLWNNGELITSAVRERIEYIFGNLTPSGQSSSPSVARTVHNNKINNIAERTIIKIDPKASGIFCIDLKTNIQGLPCVTEINVGRFFTTSNFFAKIGSNMPYYYLKMGYNEDIEKIPKFNSVKNNIYWIRLMDKGPILLESTIIKHFN